MTEKSRRSVVIYGTGHTLARTSLTPASLSRANGECGNRFCTISMDELRTTSNEAKHECAAKQVVKKRMKPR